MEYKSQDKIQNYMLQSSKIPLIIINEIKFKKVTFLPLMPLQQFQ